MDKATRDDLLDALFDLKHDLGKHIYQPLGMLPPGATAQELRAALETALFSTRKTQTEQVAARKLWVRFADEWQSQLPRFSHYEKLETAIRSALALESVLAKPGIEIERETVGATLRGVGEAIFDLIEEVKTHE
ncbi:MAG: hypothetical protein QNJ97_13655 [Myxococcota bacterium]|nr:hypothetical protein [Myxococcota bacterium]